MVKEMAQDSHLQPDQLSFINYWFRHIWEYWWPMYPGVLLATLMADINLAVFVVMMFPLTLVAVFLGGLSVRDMNKPGANNNFSKPSMGPFFHELGPILIVIVLGLSLGLILSSIRPDLDIAKEAGLIISLCIAVAWIWIENKLPVAQRKAVVFNKKLLNMTYMIIAILVFKGILEDSGAVKQISSELIAVRFPLIWIAALLPFIVGLFTGITIAFVGSTFPILISLVQVHGEAAFMPAYIMVGLTCGFSGVLLSPLHLCLLLSNEYFETVLNIVYRHLWIPCAGLLIAGMGYFQVLHWIYSAHS
jgi:integral membrane protein (TIGR00529 family)